MADFASALWNKPAAAADSTPADPVTRSLRFNHGSDSALYIEPTVDHDSSTVFTFSCWAKLGDVGADTYLIFSAGHYPDSTNQAYLYFSFNTAGQLRVTLRSAAATSATTYSSTAVFRDPSAWYHLLMVRDGASLKAYVNNTVVINQTISATTAYGVGDGLPMHVGSSLKPTSSGINNYWSFDGLLADVYFTDGHAKAPTDFIESNNYGGYIPKEYTGAFGTNGFHVDGQPSNDSDLLVSSIDRNNGDTTFADAAAGHTLTTGGDPEHSIAVGNPFTGDGRAIYFDGTNDYLTVDDGANIDLGTGDFTIEFWVNSDEETQNAFITGRWNATPNGGAWNTREWGLTCSSYGSGGLDVYVSGGGASYGGSINVCDSKWHHIAIVRSSGDAKLYVDGEYKYDPTVLDSYDMSFSSKLIIGAGQATYWRGAMYDYRISDTARYSSNFDVPTEKFTSDSNTLLLIQPDKDDTTFHDESDTSTNPVTTVSTPTRTASTPYDAAAKSTAMYFDGTGDNLVVTSDSSFNEFGTGDFTIEMWVNPTDQGSGSFAQMFELWDSSSDRMYLRIERQSSQNVYKFVVSGSDNFDVESDSAPDYGNWQHLAVVRNGTSITMYVDGTAQTDSVTISSSASYSWPSRNLKIAKGNSSIGSSADYEGYIFDYRITKGTARYTANFTAPSAPFELNPVYIGGDQSGNKNHFQPTNIDSTDIREDNPFKNHATWNPLIKRSSTPHIFTYSEGNTVATYTGGVAHTSTTIASSGVHYAEFAFSGGTSSISGAGVVRARWNDGHADSYTTNYGGCYYGSSGNVNSPAGSTSVSAVGSNRLGIAFDGANNKADFYEVESDGTKTLLKSLTSSDSIDFDGSATFTATSHDTGATSITGYFESGEWWGTAPSVGSTTATSLNTSNLDAPVVTPSEHFDILTYNGNSDLYNASGSTQNVTGVNFDVGMAWIKDRDNSSSGYTNSGSDEYGHYLFDTVTGTSSGGYNLDGDVVSSGSGTTLNSGYYGVSSFSAGSGTSRGITVDEAGETNFDYDDGSYQLTERYVAWLWKLGSTGSSSTWNSSYTAPSTEHYNASAGVTTIEVSPASSGNLEVAHSLSAAPEFFFVGTDSYADFSGYPAFHKDLTSGYYLQLDGSAAQSSDSTYFPSGAAHADYIKLGSVFADSYGYGGNLRIWAFTGVEGHSKFGTYKGAGSNGVFVYTGHRPKMVWIKNMDTTGNWFIFDAARDTYNETVNYLQAHSSTSETTNSGYKIDILSSGFRINVESTHMNNSAYDYVFCSFAESPFKHANAR